MCGLGETLCDVENPQRDLLLRPEQMVTGLKKSGARIPKFTGSKRARNVSVRLKVQRKTARITAGKTAAI